MTKPFRVTVGEVRFHPASFSNDTLLGALQRLERLEYAFECHGPRNSYQLNSTLDDAVKTQLLASGARGLPFKPSCAISIDSDFALAWGDQKVVFEIEKANKEKLLYDFLKMHIYLESDISAVVLIAPVNWAHKSGVVDLFSIAQQRFDLCKAYGMVDLVKAQRMLIVGVTQHHNGRPVDNATLGTMKKECTEFFGAG